MNISNRLKWLASFIEGGNIFADIGTDHGYVPIYLLKEKKIKKAIAMDINKGPLNKAKENAAFYNIDGKIEFRQSDGLEKLEIGEAQSVLIAGMGGILIKNILEADIKKAISLKEIVLSPHSDWEVVRRFLYENNFKILNEDMMIEDGKYYIMIKAAYSDEKIEKPQELMIRFGKKLIETKNKVLISYLENEEQKLKKVINKINGSSLEAITDINKKIYEIEKVLELMMEG